MFSIDNVQESHYNYKFPTIDCKFQNTGNATAFLWQFAVNVIQAKIDFTPIPDFSYCVKNGALEVEIINNGWGAMRDCQIQIDEPIINRLFSESVRQYRGTIDSGKSQTFLLSKEMAETKNFEAISKEFKTIGIESPGFSPFDESPEELLVDRTLTYGIKLNTLRIKLSFKDEKNTISTGEKEILINDIALTPTGFYDPNCFWIVHCCDGQCSSYVTNAIIIDPKKGSHERIYPISRKISSGDVDRFHIMVCATMSCHLRLQFEFFVDRDQIVKSVVFDINIWNPVNAELHKNYEDGVHLNRDGHIEFLGIDIDMIDGYNEL